MSKLPTKSLCPSVQIVPAALKFWFPLLAALLVIHRDVCLQVKVKIAQSCPTPCDPMNCTVCGILEAIIVEQVAVPFFRGSSQPRGLTQVSSIASRFFTS